MIDVMTESADDILGVRATGRLTKADYDTVLQPCIELLLSRFRAISVLFLMDESFGSWSLGAAWANTVLVLEHRRNLRRVAMVGGPDWEKWCAERAASPLLKGDLRTFRLDQASEAWHWLRSPESA